VHLYKRGRSEDQLEHVRPRRPCVGFGFRVLVSGFWFLVSGFWFLVSGCRLRGSRAQTLHDQPGQDTDMPVGGSKPVPRMATRYSTSPFCSGRFESESVAVWHAGEHTCVRVER